MKLFNFLAPLILIASLSCSHQHNDVKNILPRNSFLKIQKYLDITMCHPKKKDLCITKRFGATASGVVVEATENGAYVLTAAHVCVDEKAKRYLSKIQHKMFFYVINIESAHFPVEIIATDPPNDLCILYVKGLQNPAVRLAADKPDPGDRVYNIAAPIGIFDKNMVPIFEGFYNGDSSNRAIYTLPAKGGSSGSPIINHRGELIGMVSAAFIRFSHLAISPEFKETTTFVEAIVDSDRRKRNLAAVADFIGKIFNEAKPKP
jgi:hypothetical protein